MIHLSTWKKCTWHSHMNFTTTSMHMTWQHDEFYPTPLYLKEMHVTWQHAEFYPTHSKWKKCTCHSNLNCTQLPLNNRNAHDMATLISAKSLKMTEMHMTRHWHDKFYQTSSEWKKSTWHGNTMNFTRFHLMTETHMTWQHDKFIPDSIFF